MTAPADGSPFRFGVPARCVRCGGRVRLEGGDGVRGRCEGCGADQPKEPKAPPLGRRTLVSDPAELVACLLPDERAVLERAIAELQPGTCWWLEPTFRLFVRLAWRRALAETRTTHPVCAQRALVRLAATRCGLDPLPARSFARREGGLGRPRPT